MIGTIELNGPLGFEQQQGLHTIPVVEFPPRTSRSLVRILRREVQYPFQVFPSLPSLDQLAFELDNRGVLCFPNIEIQASPTAKWLSKHRLSVFIAHGSRDANKKHVISWQDKKIESQNAFERLNSWCDGNGVPKPQVFISCDERVGPITTRWDQSSKFPVIGFSGEFNSISVDEMINTLYVNLDEMRRANLGPNPFSSSSHPSRNLVKDLFVLKINKP